MDPPDGRLPALTPEAQQSLAAREERRRTHPSDSWLDRKAWDRCITDQGVPPISTSYNNTYQILQTPDYVAILVENIHDVRVIPLDGRPRLDDNIRQWNGDSRGHWEGDTLVVETANYSDKTELRFPSSMNTRAVERFTRVDENLIDYQFTIDDPTVYTQPWTAVRPMPRLDHWLPDHVGHGQDVLPDLGREAKHTHDLGDPGAGDSLPACDLGLACGLVRLQEGLPLDGLAQQFDHPGCPGILTRFWLAPVGHYGAYDPVGRHPARQGADVGALEGPFGSEAYLDSLFLVVGVLTIYCYMDDPEPDFGVIDTGPMVSRPGY